MIKFFLFKCCLRAKSSCSNRTEPEKIEPKAVALIAPHPVLLQVFKIKALFLNAVAKGAFRRGRKRRRNTRQKTSAWCTQPG